MAVKRNIIANYAGSAWTGIMGLVFVPTYIRMMGIESYGLVGFFGMLVSLFAVLDMGLSQTLNREMARRSNQAGQEQASRDLLRTLELIYWPVAVLIGTVVIMLSFPIARYWINPDKLSITDVRQAVMIMGLVVVLRWPFGLYLGGLMGLQKQVLVNTINCIAATFRGLGAVLILWLVAPTIQAFFIWQIVTSGLETFAMAFFLRRSLPHSKSRPRFQQSLIAAVWRFAAGMLGMNIVLLLTQTDKIILSKMLSLEMYGYYMLACTAAGSLYKVVTPILSAVYPQVTRLVAEKKASELTFIYHQFSQFISVIVLPLATVIGFFSYDVLMIWTGDPVLAATTHLTLSFLIIGSTCNLIMGMPYITQLAHGWTSLAFWSNTALMLALIPGLIFLVPVYGMVGGATVWAVVNVGYLLISIPIMHKRILKGDMFAWLSQDVGPPVLVSIAVSLLMRAGMPSQLNRIESSLFLILTTLLAFLVCAMLSSSVRNSVIREIAVVQSWTKQRIFNMSQ